MLFSDLGAGEKFTLVGTKTVRKRMKLLDNKEFLAQEGCKVCGGFIRYNSVSLLDGSLQHTCQNALVERINE